MSTKNKDLGAFPLRPAYSSPHSKGLSKREWFAGMIVQGLLVSHHDLDYLQAHKEQIYKLADKMLEGQCDE